MKKLLLSIFVMTFSVAIFAQNCGFSVTTNSPGVGIFTPAGTFPVNIYSWDFGDGTTGISYGPIAHTYPTGGGAYSVCMNVQDTMGTLLCTFCDSVLIQPTVSCPFTTYITPGSLIVDFLVSVPAGHYAHWDYGDGTVGNGSNPWHTYPANGSYTVCVDLIDSATSTSTCHSCQTISLGSSTNNCTYSAFPDSMNPQLFYFFGSPAYQTSAITWTFGDGSNGSGQYAQHQYTSPGVYQVCMYENNPNGVNICHHCDSVVVNTGGTGFNCNFNFSLSGSNPTVGTFVSLVTGPGTAFIHWDFGNGQTTTGNFGTATYTAPGTYVVVMTATDGAGNVLCSATQVVVINSTVPSCASYFVSSSAGLNASFIDLSTGITPATSFTWSFGDGTSATTRFPQHTYAAPGIYTVCLTIADSGCSNIYCASILVDTTTNPSGNCQASFVKIQTAPFNVIVVDLSTGSNLNYFWDFGDGMVSNQQYPSHYYPMVGTYNLCLTVSNGLLGCTSTFCDTLTVDSMGNVLRSTMTGFTVNVVSPGMLTGIAPGPVSTVNVTTYPNPVIDRLYVDRTGERKASYRILDLRGAVVMSGSISGRQSVIEMAGLSSGSYLIEVSEPGTSSAYSRFIKE